MYSGRDEPVTANVDEPKSDPAAIAALALDGVAAGAPEVVATRSAGTCGAGSLSADLTALYPQLAVSAS
jgi:hypothetical protein